MSHRALAVARRRPPLCQRLWLIVGVEYEDLRDSQSIRGSDQGQGSCTYRLIKGYNCDTVRVADATAPLVPRHVLLGEQLLALDTCKLVQNKSLTSFP
jgi:hypothetical protein